MPLLARMAEISEAERAGLVWTEEGVDEVRTFVVADRYSLRPRGEFTAEHLGDLKEFREAQRGPRRGGLRATFDGAREWFVALDAGFRPLRSDGRAVAALESAARKLGKILTTSGGELDPSFSPETDLRRETFPGWILLGDHERDPPERVRARFAVVHLLDRLSEEAFVAPASEIRTWFPSVRTEVSALPRGDAEREAIERILESLAAPDLDRLGMHLSTLGAHLEDHGRMEAAGAFHRLAYWAAVEGRSYRRAVTAARLIGRALRKRAEWKPADAWYQLAFDVADALGDRASMALSLQGRASSFRDRGSLPRARETLAEALTLATESESRQAVAQVRHELMAVAHVSGDNVEAALHGWEAVRHYDDRTDLVRALADLAEACRGAGDLDAAELGFRLVLARSSDTETVAHALGTLAEIAALKGDRRALHRCVDRFGAARPDTPMRAVVRFLFDVGEAWTELDEVERATEAFREVVSLSEAHGFAQLLIEAEARIRSLPAGPRKAQPARVPPAALREVREGLAGLEASLTG